VQVLGERPVRPLSWDAALIEVVPPRLAARVAHLAARFAWSVAENRGTGAVTTVIACLTCAPTHLAGRYNFEACRVTACVETVNLLPCATADTALLRAEIVLVAAAVEIVDESVAPALHPWLVCDSEETGLVAAFAELVDSWRSIAWAVNPVHEEVVFVQ
jgi:hypothetical protein